MEVTRILDLRNFDRYARRFRDVVYKNSSRRGDEDTPDGRGGFSVIDTACACTPVTDDCICAHIHQFYDRVGPEPCAFWTFDPAVFNPPNPNPNKLEPPVLVP